MKSEHFSEDHEPVRKLLREWQVTSPLPPRFSENVWRRIEQADSVTASASTPASSWAVLKNWLAVTLPRPAFAVSYVGVLMVAGLLGGYWHARSDTTSWDKALASRYVQAVDPFQKSINN